MDQIVISDLIVVFVFILITLVIIIFTLFYTFNKRRLYFISEKQKSRIKYEKELEASRIENQEHLLKALSWELHDNIGQLLSVSNLQLSMISEDVTEKDRKLIADTREILSKVLEDVRNLSKSLNADSFIFLGLAKAVSFEIERLNRLRFVDAKFTFEGKETEISNEHQIILFRIIQECISNMIKHARATRFSVAFLSEPQIFTIICEDNGLGMNLNTKNYGLGLKNIVSRANMIGAETLFEPVTGGGLRIKIFYPIR